MKKSELKTLLQEVLPPHYSVISQDSVAFKEVALCCYGVREDEARYPRYWLRNNDVFIKESGLRISDNSPEALKDLGTHPDKDTGEFLYLFNGINVGSEMNRCLTEDERKQCFEDPQKLHEIVDEDIKFYEIYDGKIGHTEFFKPYYADYRKKGDILTFVDKNMNALNHAIGYGAEIGGVHDSVQTSVMIKHFKKLNPYIETIAKEDMYRTEVAKKAAKFKEMPKTHYKQMTLNDLIEESSPSK